MLLYLLEPAACLNVYFVNYTRVTEKKGYQQVHHLLILINELHNVQNYLLHIIIPIRAIFFYE
jgi:hypothetical protein